MVRRLSALLASSLAVLTLYAVAPASAARYEGTGLDANDRARGSNCCYIDPDFRSSTRKVWVDRKGRAWLTITFRTYDPLAGGPYEVFVRLDTRGGPLAEFRMHLFDSGMGPPFGCNLRSLTSGKYRRGVLRGPDFESDGSNRRASCRVRLAWLRPNKRIRWALYSPPFLGHDEDFAPRPGGWYETAA